ncbi:hypothetical protein KW782_00240 [Candidatus Parcubacteria bacterium]|nr:hypothetical protein [Candidatus Parcubacteria bacterium]
MATHHCCPWCNRPVTAALLLRNRATGLHTCPHEECKKDFCLPANAEKFVPAPEDQRQMPEERGHLSNFLEWHKDKNFNQENTDNT